MCQISTKKYTFVGNRSSKWPDSLRKWNMIPTSPRSTYSMRYRFTNRILVYTPCMTEYTTNQRIIPTPGNVVYNTDSRHFYEKGPLRIATTLLLREFSVMKLESTGGFPGNFHSKWLGIFRTFPTRERIPPYIFFLVAHRLAGRRAEIMGYWSWLWCRHQCFGDELEETEGAAARTAGRFLGKRLDHRFGPERKRIFESYNSTVVQFQNMFFQQFSAKKVP